MAVQLECSVMDPLSDLLRVVRLDGAHFYPVEAAAPWSVHSLPAKELTPRVMPHAEHLVSYHIVTEGRCYGGLRGEEQIELNAGDVIVFPHGDAHVMASDRGLRVGDDLHSMLRPHSITVSLGEGRRTTSLVCGYLGCDLRPFNPLLAALPRRMHMSGMSGPWLEGFTRRLSDDARLGRAGADAVLTRLAETMFVEVVRRYLEELDPGERGWLAGLRDEMVGQVLGLIHAEPQRPWTLDQLAREVASSRSNLSKRFTDVVGQPPMQYLTSWRMQVASTLLVESGAKLATIAARVGYASEAAFSRAFKSATGMSPGAWRASREGMHA
jgi:AraC-like DNA-binding protein